MPWEKFCFASRLRALARFSSDVDGIWCGITFLKLTRDIQLCVKRHAQCFKIINTAMMLLRSSASNIFSRKVVYNTFYF